MSRSKATRAELEAALAQVRSSKMTIRGTTKRDVIVRLEARIKACPPEKGVGGARVAAVRARERERIDRMVNR